MDKEKELTKYDFERDAEEILSRSKIVFTKRKEKAGSGYKMFRQIAHNVETYELVGRVKDGIYEGRSESCNLGGLNTEEKCKQSILYSLKIGLSEYLFYKYKNGEYKLKTINKMDSSNYKIVHNQRKNGLEISFSSKPDDAILEQLKQWKFRWSKYAKIWYVRYSPEIEAKVKAFLAGEKAPDIENVKGEPQKQVKTDSNVITLHKPIIRKVSKFFNALVKGVDDSKDIVLYQKYFGQFDNWEVEKKNLNKSEFIKIASQWQKAYLEFDEKSENRFHLYEAKQDSYNHPSNISFYVKNYKFKLAEQPEEKPAEEQPKEKSTSSPSFSEHIQKTIDKMNKRHEDNAKAIQAVAEKQKESGARFVVGEKVIHRDFEFSQRLEKTMPTHQKKIVKGSEEFNSVIEDLNKDVAEIPKLYEQHGKGKQAIVYLHYFYGGSDWYVTEFDGDKEFFGYVVLNGDYEMSEFGYIPVEELVSDGRIELDFYWERKTLKEALNKYEESETEDEPEEQPAKTHTYQLGDKYRSDFDYEGMINMGFSAIPNWSVSDLQKLYDSFEDVNYHEGGKYLGNAIKAIKDGASKQIVKKHFDNFHTALRTINNMPNPFEETKEYPTNKDKNTNESLVIGDIVKIDGIDGYMKIIFRQKDQQAVLYPYDMEKDRTDMSADFIKIDDDIVKKHGLIKYKKFSESEEGSIYYGDNDKKQADADLLIAEAEIEIMEMELELKKSKEKQEPEKKQYGGNITKINTKIIDEAIADLIVSKEYNITENKIAEITKEVQKQIDKKGFQKYMRKKGQLALIPFAYYEKLSNNDKKWLSSMGYFTKKYGFVVTTEGEVHILDNIAKQETKKKPVDKTLEKLNNAYIVKDTHQNYYNYVVYHLVNDDKVIDSQSMLSEISKNTTIPESELKKLDVFWYKKDGTVEHEFVAEKAEKNEDTNSKEQNIKSMIAGLELMSKRAGSDKQKNIVSMISGLKLMLKRIEKQQPEIKTDDVKNEFEKDSEKEAWQMDLVEFYHNKNIKIEKWIDDEDKKKINFVYETVVPYTNNRGDKKMRFDISQKSQNINEAVKKLHKKIIERAIYDGKNVPDEVLKDYPELIKTPIKEITGLNYIDVADKKKMALKIAKEVMGKRTTVTIKDLNNYLDKIRENNLFEYAFYGDSPATQKHYVYLVAELNLSESGTENLEKKLESINKKVDEANDKLYQRTKIGRDRGHSAGALNRDIQNLGVQKDIIVAERNRIKNEIEKRTQTEKIEEIKLNSDQQSIVDKLNEVIAVYKRNDEQEIQKQIYDLREITNSWKIKNIKDVLGYYQEKYFTEIVIDNPEKIKDYFSIVKQIGKKDRVPIYQYFEKNYQSWWDNKPFHNFVANLKTNFWNLIPDEYKYVNDKDIKEIKFEKSPDDANLVTIMSEFTANDYMRLPLATINFDEEGIVATDAHKLLYIHGKPQKKGMYCITKECMKLSDKKNLSKDYQYPNYKEIIPYKNNHSYKINAISILTYINALLKAQIISDKDNSKAVVGFKFDYNEKTEDYNRYIAFNALFLKESIEAMLKLGHKELAILLSSRNRASLIVPYESIDKFNGYVNPPKTDFALIMPVMMVEDDKNAKYIYNWFYYDLLENKACTIFNENNIDCINVIPENKNIFNTGGQINIFK